MSFDAALMPDEAYSKLVELARNIKSKADQTVIDYDSSVTVDQIISTAYGLKAIDAEMDALRLVPGIVQYAKDLKNDQTYNVVVEYQAMQAAIDAFLAEVQTSMPTDASGWIQGWKFGATEKTRREFAPAATATLKMLAQAIADSISI